ncbi:MAG: aspartate kinase [Candidatus Levybacteria bacterium RIFCSPHIGHO2_02_FULL_37_10]|nr:MAG: aspartate kinase [Candidatus Levybacteria bacterium RIFCSPHIGHO2_02_FULL_37_10]OGH41603.1 MAG: aspartate kinase [Candidatus Levybacteria bacterium RIFCSPLOWO2_02_FULL_36_8b]
MGSNYKDKIVISVGGSLIVPNGGIDTAFLIKFNKFIRARLAENKKRQFFLIVGGGITTRHYQNAARKVIGDKLTHNDLDWLGIHATRLNAHLIRTIFRDVAHNYILKHYEIIRKVEESVVVGSGWKPGWSTDFCAIMTCQDYDVKTVINLSNINQIYDKDPNKFKDAKPIDEISWKDLRELVGDKWTPGMHVPFDPIAAKKAQSLGVKAIIINGNNFENLENYFSGKKFLGTVIE